MVNRQALSQHSPIENQNLGTKNSTNCIFNF
jgi:hypothetical protein